MKYLTIRLFVFIFVMIMTITITSCGKEENEDLTPSSSTVPDVQRSVDGTSSDELYPDTKPVREQ